MLDMFEASTSSAPERASGTRKGTCQPWTAAQAASDDVSKKMLIQYLQEHAEATFVTENKLNGVITAVVTRVTKEQLVEMYEKHISSVVDASASSDAAEAASEPTNAFTFAPSAEASSDNNDGSAFAFNTAAGQSEATRALPPAASTASADQGATPPAQSECDAAAAMEGG
ncbi:peptidyl-prolyl cis-trans isomerase fkbp3-like isoform 2 [Chrysochromulina tobinii]|uniref:Peptidyl-prolyl cis-trans isomerase fkbp3-like isoform 2 n=1 Tax=Chrysochromulina tobinii TaxID=1460289 RepID=A0A0M0JUP8_9EUKA|nr:peptidyl-prolyl cis-trans isomerase fkbp3-like isoform 2 [Chrysochromulina tobinii]|eukprot:KOO29848.1 peptidyl-prolyl cis-trans isomerase fkbp3-like isoform 2 [Chrysochromulina sp. CCMP291]